MACPYKWDCHPKIFNFEISIIDIFSSFIKPQRKNAVSSCSERNFRAVTNRSITMKTRKYLSLFPGFLTAILMASPALAKKDLPEVNGDGMQLVKNTKMATIYADPGADLSIYTKILLKDTSVSFKKNWQREQNRSSGAFRVKDSDAERIKEDTSTLFREVFSKELEDGGYVLVDAPGEDVLMIQPAIINLDVVAPDVKNAYRSKSFSESAGEMTLVLELYDSQTNDLIVTAKDRKRDWDKGYFEWRNSVTNRHFAKRMMSSWAKTFTESLDEARLTVNAVDL